MAKRHGRLGEFHLGDSGGTLRDLTSWLSNIEMPRNVETAQVTTLNEDDHTFVVGIRGGNIRLTGLPSEDANALDEVLEGILGFATAVAWKWFPAGSVASRIVYSGSAIATEYSPGGGVAGAAAATGGLVLNGPVVRGTV